MGCDIHSYAEIRQDGTWEQVGQVFPLDRYYQKAKGRSYTASPFARRNYGVFAFLADIRNYSHVPCIQQPTYILPEDISASVAEEAEYWSGDAHSYNVLTLRQLSEYDYEQKFWNRRVMKQIGPNLWTGAGLAEEGEGEHPVLREFLGEQFFVDLETLKTLGGHDDVRVVFWFDN